MILCFYDAEFDPEEEEEILVCHHFIVSDQLGIPNCSTALFWSTSTVFTLPETNVAPENWWLEDVFPIEIVPFQVLC